MAFDGGEDTGATGGAADLFGSGATAAGGGGAGAGGEQQQDTGFGGEGGTGGAADPDWFEKLSAEAGEGETSSNRDWAKAKGVKDLDGLTKMARDTERALRENGRIKVPGDGAKPEEVAAFRTAIGVPDKPDAYEVKAPEGVALNEPLIQRMRESALAHGAPKGAFEGLIGDFIQAQREEADAIEQTQIGEATAWLKEQGGRADEQKAHIDAAGRALGLTRADMLWFRGMPGGAGRALTMLSKLGSGMAEDTLITGGKGRFGVTGAEAQVEIDKLKADPDFQKKVMVPGSAERMRWDRLNLAAAEGKAKAEQQF